MSKKHRIGGLRRRCQRLKASIEANTALLKLLERRLTFMLAEHAVEKMPESMRNILVDSSRANWDQPRKPAVNDDR
jgi:hypothetical protein